MALTPEQQDLVDLVRAAEALTDRVTTGFWERVLALFTAFGGRQLTHDDRRALMREVDRLVDRVYGLTQKAALTSQLFATIVQATDMAAEVPFRRAIQRVRNVTDRRDPAWWNRIRAQASPTSKDGFLRVVASLDGDVVTKRRLLNAGRLDRNRAWVKKERWNTNSGYRLSDRVWFQGKGVRRDIDERIRLGLSQGEDALKMAKDLEQYLLKAARPVTITSDGKVIARLNQTATPGRGGYGSYQARRLARTEVTRILGDATIESAKVTPGVIGIRWALSASHEHVDECNDHASRDNGMGPGVYTVADLPAYPSHPHEKCTLRHEVMNRKDFMAELLKKYGA